MVAAALFTHGAARAQSTGEPAEEASGAGASDSNAAPAGEAGRSEPPAVPPPALTPFVFTRIGFRLQDAADPRRLNHLSADELNIAPGASGSVLDNVSWTFSLYAVGQTQSDALLPTGGSVTVLDMTGKIDFADALHLWLGRMVIPADRSGFSGTYFMSAWNYPGVYAAGGAPVVAAPKGDYLGRGVGATAWGELGGGLLKYYVGAYDLDRAAGYPLYSGRLNLALINPEPGYWHGSTYYGAKDIIAIGIGGQFQKDGSSELIVDPTTGTVTPGARRDYRELNANLLVELNLGGGTLTTELAIYDFEGYVSAAPVDLSYFALLKYLVPGAIGGGRLEPLFRYQATRDPDLSSIDAGLGFIVAGPLLRFHANFQRTNMGRNAAGENVIGNAVQLGMQMLHLNL